MSLFGNAIAQKYADYKRRHIESVIATTDDPAVLEPWILILNRMVPTDRQILEQFAESSWKPSVRLIAIRQLLPGGGITDADAAQLYCEIYRDKRSNKQDRKNCLARLIDGRYLELPETKALINDAMIGDPDEEVREWARTRWEMHLREKEAEHK